VVGSVPVLDALDIYGENLHTRNIVTDSMSCAMQHNAHCSIRWSQNTGRDEGIM